MQRLFLRKIDGTNVTQMLSSMMIWSHSRSMLDELVPTVVWPNTSLTHRMTQMMLGTNDNDEIEFFVNNIMSYIQLPYACFTEKNYGERQFVVGNSSCISKFGFSDFDKDGCAYLCNMDVAQGDVRCEGGRMWLKIMFYDSETCSSQTMLAASTPNSSPEEIWMLVS